MPTRAERFESLLRDYSRLIGGAIRRVCRRQYRMLVPDVEQDVYQALWNRLGSGKEIEHPPSVLYKVALTAALAAIRRHAPQTAPLESVPDPSLASPGAVGDLLPEERAQLLAELLASLPAESARALRAHLAGFSHEEVAALFGWSPSVARHRIYRGIEALREKSKGGRTRVRAAARS